MALEKLFLIKEVKESILLQPLAVTDEVNKK